MLRPILSAVVLSWTMATALPADVFILESGGRVTGELLNPDETPREKYVIKTSARSQITLQRSQVKQVLTVRPAEAEYQKLRPAYPDTVEGQWALAQWCFEQRLLAQREVHLRRLIELDRDHAEARHALGYAKYDGKWMTRDERMEAMGYRRYKGEWKLPQEIELMESRRTADIAEKEWFQKINRWRGWLGTEKGEQARQGLQAIDDPRAVKALASMLDDDRRPAVRVLAIEILGKLGTSDAIKFLAARSVEDPVEEIRLSCLDQLKGKKNPDLVAFYVGKLRSKDNACVNRAALALSQLSDRSAIGPLIDALVTTHKYKITTGSGNPGSISTTFGTGGAGAPGGGGLAVGSSTTTRSVQLANQPVLDALVALTGMNYNFNKQQWRSWYTSQKKQDSVDARRD